VGKKGIGVLWNGGKSGVSRGEIDILAPIFTIDSPTWLQPQRNFPIGGVNMAVAHWRYHYSIALTTSVSGLYI
jgi:hypothetical protein